MGKIKFCGNNSPIGWIILNKNWPKGTDPHLRRCNGCEICEPDNPDNWLEALKDKSS